MDAASSPKILRVARCRPVLESESKDRVFRNDAAIDSPSEPAGYDPTGECDINVKLTTVESQARVHQETRDDVPTVPAKAGPKGQQKFTEKRSE